ncbi:hypothetical protein EVAR_29969_1 [Eumeta japonica]|uniref:Uncharacterized protein n=1 Tax=Eumeta variegata TaxID=151549 RepID=A0A4C1VHK1_EUMVA|nr:hypothetical protein EVAR_29969_1 [Eumeta japonica]
MGVVDDGILKGMDLLFPIYIIRMSTQLNTKSNIALISQGGHESRRRSRGGYVCGQTGVGVAYCSIRESKGTRMIYDQNEELFLKVNHRRRANGKRDSVPMARHVDDAKVYLHS